MHLSSSHYRIFPITLLLFACGCPDRPRAPLLRDDPVYQNDREGFRFLAPDGWTMRAKSEVPSGSLEKQRTLVEYLRLTEDKTAMLEVSVANSREISDLPSDQAKPAFGITQWNLVGSPEAITIDGQEALRFHYLGKSGKPSITREVTVFRRKNRDYFFTGMYPESDTKARDEIRRAVGSTIWKS